MIRPFRAAVLLVVFASACTLVNAYDDVKPLTDGVYAPGAPAPFDAAVGSAAEDAASTGPDATTAGPGAIVVAATVPGDGGERSVLTVLDPRTGREIGAREPLVVSAIRYDGVRDLWYLFEPSGSDFIAGPKDGMTLHVRALDRATGAWTETARLAVPPLQSYDSVAVVKDRLLYVAHPDPEGGSAVRLVTIDTTDPAKPTQLDVRPLDRAPRGMVATRNTSGAGGVVGMVRTGAGAEGCGETGSCVEIVRVRVANVGPPEVNAARALGPIGGGGAVPSYASLASLDREVIVFPRASGADAASPSSAFLFEPRNQVLDPVGVQFVVTDSLLRRAAVNECGRQLFVVGGNGDLDVHAVPLLRDGGGTPSTGSTGHSGQSVYFEPTTKTVLTPFSQGTGFDLTAFRVTGAADAPELVKRTPADWNPPADLRPILLGIREPYPIVCP